MGATLGYSSYLLKRDPNPMKVKLLILSIVFVFIMLFITLPAERVIDFLPNNSGVKVAQVKGKLWLGEAFQVNYQDRVHFQKVSWDLDWSALARLQLKLNVKFNNGANAIHGEGATILSWSGFSVEDFSVDASASELSAYFYLTPNVQVSGQVSAKIKVASLGTPYCQKLEGDIDWHKALVNSERGTLRLGDVHNKLQCQSGNIIVDIKQNSNDLITNLRLVFEKDKIYRVKGIVAPGVTLDPEFNKLLRWVGPENAAGEKLLNFSGRL